MEKALDVQAGQYFTPSLGGSSKRIAEAYREGNETILDFLLSEINIGIAHGAKELILHHHSRCAAYGIEHPLRAKRTQLADCRDSHYVLSERFAGISIFSAWEELMDAAGNFSKFTIMTLEEIEAEIQRLDELIVGGMAMI